MNKLSYYTKNRDNNFNLIRFVAALLVLFTHSYALSLGSRDYEPMAISLGITWGDIAVDIFFVTSGFLITSSFFTRRHLIAFIWARILRIYPALIIAVLFCVFVVGVLFTTHATWDYLFDSKTFKYLVLNSTMMRHPAWILPGVFEEVPYEGAVNGSLWTLPYELKMYIFLAIIASVLTCIKITAGKLKGSFTIIALTLVTVYIVNHFQHFVMANETIKYFRLGAMFFAGTACYLCRDNIRLYRNVFIIVFVALLLSVTNKDLFFVCYTLSLPYLIFYLAYVPSGVVRKFNDFGDYSYGLYIYAFPVQQSVASIIPGVSVEEMFVLSFCVTMILAFLSWHLIEKKCLKMKGKYVVIEDKLRKIYFVMTNKKRCQL